MQFKFPVADLLIFTVFALCFVNAWGGGDKVKLQDIKTLTLHHGKMTTARRGYAVPQLHCVGGTAGCTAFVPRVVQCYNKGWDGNDVQWKCETDMDNAYRFGNVEVTCEGYDYPDDPYVLKGSCGLEYQLDLTKEGYEHQSHNYYGGNSYSAKQTKTDYSFKKSGGLGDVVMIVAVGLVIYALYKTCLAPQMTGGDDAGGGQGGPRRPGWFGGGGNDHGNPQPPPPGFRPEYYDSGNAGCGNTGGGRQGGGGGGFWTGAMTGGLLGYMFGNRGTRNHNYHYAPPASGGGWFSSGRTSHSSGYASTSTASSPQSTGTRTASGFGGTKRR